MYVVSTRSGCWTALDEMKRLCTMIFFLHVCCDVVEFVGMDPLGASLTRPKYGWQALSDYMPSFLLQPSISIHRKNDASNQVPGYIEQHHAHHVTSDKTAKELL